jgi:CubicO group peptidase (beta-lactamase class C family)
LESLRTILESGIAAGLHAGAIAAAWINGQSVFECACGTRDDGKPLQIDDVLLWMSSGKPIGAVAAMQLVERGQLELDRPLAQDIPEFAQGNKQGITLRHLLTHTGGFRWVDTRGAEFDATEIWRRICAAPLEKDWLPGETAGYHPFTSWFALGQWIERIDGRSFSQYVREEIFLPLRMNDCWIGMPIDQQTAYGARLVATHETNRPGSPIHKHSTPAGRAVCVPGGNGHGPLPQLLRFYEMLRRGGELEGTRLLHAETVSAMVGRQREGKRDATFGHIVDFGLGLIINSAKYGANTVPYGYGDSASKTTFGHGGAQSSIAFCDPERELVAGIIFTGMPGEVAHQRRARRALNALYAELPPK